jgi:hypothetical protein
METSLNRTEEGGFGRAMKILQGIPVGRGYLVTRFASVDTCEFEGPVKESAAMK